MIVFRRHLALAHLGATRSARKRNVISISSSSLMLCCISIFSLRELLKFRSPAIAELSTDSRKLFAGKHVDDTGAADACFHHDKTGMIARDFTDDGGVLTKAMRFHGAQDEIDILRGDNGEKLSFVRNIKRIEAENLAGAFHFFADRNARLVEKHPNFRRLRDFSKR